MSGHSKWSTIKHKKAITDAKKGKVFTKLAKQITIAVQQGGNGDPNSNPSLRLYVDKARQANMPNDNVRRAIERGLGKGEGGRLEEVSYEGYGPFGVGMIVSCVTDNRNRTGSDVRNLMEKAGGSIGGPGSVTYLKHIQPIPRITLPDGSKEKVEILLDQLDELDDVVEVWTNLA